MVSFKCSTIPILQNDSTSFTSLFTIFHIVTFYIWEIVKAIFFKCQDSYREQFISYPCPPRPWACLVKPINEGNDWQTCPQCKHPGPIKTKNTNTPFTNTQHCLKIAMPLLFEVRKGCCWSVKKAQGSEGIVSCLGVRVCGLWP